MWLHHRKFQEVMRASWRNTEGGEDLIEKLKICGVSLTQWASKEFGSIRKRKKELYNQLNNLQLSESCEANLEEQRRVESELDIVLQHEETMWFQRSRALWLKDGDKNSKFFHQKATHRKNRNTIKCMKREDGQDVTKQEEIEKEI